MKPSPCSCRKHADCKKERRSWEVSIERISSPFSFRVLPHVHQAQLLVFWTAALSLEGVLHLVSGLLPITPHCCPPLPSASRSHDWHPWPTGCPDFLAACMLPAPSTWTSDHWPHLSGWYPGSSIHFWPLNTIYNSNPWISLLALNWSLEQWFSKGSTH